MNEIEHIRERLFRLENMVRHLMAQSIQLMPLAAAENLNRLGLEWDKQLDEIDAQFKGSGNTSALGEGAEA